MGESFQKTAVNLESIAPLVRPNGPQSEALFGTIVKTKLTGLIRSAVWRNLKSPWPPMVFSKSFTSSLSKILIPARSLMDDPLLNKVRQVTNGWRLFLLRQRCLGSMPKRFLLVGSLSTSSGSWKFNHLRVFPAKNGRATG
jgi:hypothetical protein